MENAVTGYETDINILSYWRLPQRYCFEEKNLLETSAYYYQKHNNNDTYVSDLSCNNILPDILPKVHRSKEFLTTW